MALDLTYDPNWKPDSKSGDVDLTYDPNWKPQGILGGLGSSLKRGIDSTVDYGKISLTDNPDEIAGIVSENIRNRPQPSAAQQKMNAEIAPYAKEASDAQGIVGNIGAYAKLYGKRAMQLAENPREFAGMVAENLPNSAPGIAGMVAGGAAGAATPVPFGAAIGGVVGGTAGGYKIEQGSSMFDQVVKEAQARGIDTNNKPAMSAMIAEKYPEFLKASQLKGVGTAGTDAVLNVATLGVAGIGERALAREARSVADLAKAGKMTGEEAASAIAGIEAKNAARNTIGQKALRGAGVAAGEMAGESLSEAAGQQLAYGKLDPLDVVDEGLLAFGQGVGMAAGRKFISPLVGATDKDSVTQEIERARAFATALNQSVGGDVNAVPTLITDLGPLQQRIDDLHGIGNARMNDAERAKYEQEFNAAFGEVVGYTTDKDGMEIPFTMGDYLNSQVRSADITRDRPKAANAAQQSESRLQQVADEETTGYVAPEIPVVGTLSAVANMAIKSGAHAQNQMQQAMQAALAKQGKPEKANGPIAAATDAQVATQGAQGAGGNVPGSAGVSPSALAGNQERAGNGAEVAAPGLRPAVSAGIAGVPAGQLTPEVSRAAQPSQVAAQAAQANGPQARSEQAAAQASAFDVSQRTNGQLSYLASNGQPGWKEAAVAELQKRGVQVSAPQQAKSDTLATTANVNSDRPATADQILSGKKAAYAEMAATGAPDDVVARSVMRWQEQANSRNESMNLWRSENGALGLVPASQKSPFVNGALVTTIHPESSGSANSASVPALKAEDSAKTPAAPVEVNVEVRQNQKAKGEKLIFINGEQVGVVSRARSPGTSDWGFRGSLSGELHFTEEKAVAAETEAAKKHYSNRIKVAAMEAEMPPAAETKPKPENKKPTEPPTFWTSSTPAHRKWIMDASGLKQYTAVTPWNRIKPEHQALLIEQWSDKPADQNPVKNEAPAAAMVSKETKAPEQEPIKKTAEKPRMGESADELIAALKKAAEGVVHEGKILYPTIFVPGMGGSFRMNADGSIEKIVSGGFGVAKASEEEINDVQDSIAKDQVQVVLRSRWGGSGSSEIKVVKELHSPTGNSFSNKSTDGAVSQPKTDAAPESDEYESRVKSRIERIKASSDTADIDRILAEEYKDESRHFEGTSSVERAASNRKQDIKIDESKKAVASKRSEQERLVAEYEGGNRSNGAIESISADLREAERTAAFGADTYAESKRWTDNSAEVQRLRGLQARLNSALPEASKPNEDTRFAKNTIFTADKVAAAKARMKAKLGTMNSGIDPELLIDGMTVAGAYIESGVRKFADYAKAMVEDLGDGVKPYLLSFYEAARAYPGLNKMGMDTQEAAAKQHQAILTPEARQDKAQGITPQHVENGKAEPATAAAVEQSLKKGAAHSPLDLRQERDLLLKKVDQAIAAAPTAEEKGAWDRVNQKIDLKNNMHVDDTIGYRMFDVPGDGKFKVLNLKEALQRFRDRVEANPGFKKAVNATGLQKVAPWQRTTSGGTEATVKELLDQGEYSAANEYAKQIGKPLIFGQYQDGSSVTVYTEAKPFERKGYDDFNMVSVRAVGAADKVAWAVVDLNSGLTVSSKHPTRLKAIAETNKALDKTTPEQMATAVRSAKANMPGIVGTQEELEQRWLVNVEQREADAQAKAEQEHRKGLRSHRGMIADATGKPSEDVGKKPAQAESSKVDYKGFKRVDAGYGKFELHDGNMVVKVESTSSGKYQASFRGAKSSPHLVGEQGAIDWAASYRNAARQNETDDQRYERIRATPVMQRDDKDVKWANEYKGRQQRSEAEAEAKKAEEQKAAIKAQRNFRNIDALNPLTAPVEDGNWFNIGGKDWQARNGYTGRGWALIDADKKTHPTINNIDANADLIREIVQANESAKSGDSNPTVAAEKPAESKSQNGTSGAEKNGRDSFTLERLNRETNSMEPVTFERGEYVRYSLGAKDVFGEIDGISHAKREFSVDGLWYPFGFAYKADRPVEAARTDTVPLSSVIEKANAKFGEGLTEADRVPRQYRTLADIDSAIEGIFDGTVSLADYKAAFNGLMANKEAIVTELGKMTIPQLHERFGKHPYGRQEKKGDIVERAFEIIRNAFALRRSFGPNSYTFSNGGLARFEADKLAALTDMVNASTAEDLKAFADEIGKTRAARQEKIEAAQDPKTIEDFDNALRLKKSEGMTFAEARMSLTTEQRAEYDRLKGIESRNQRKARADQQKTDVRVASQTTEGQVIETKHTKTGDPLFVVKAAERVERDVYAVWNATAKRMGGYYSAFRGNGAVPGFQFKTRENADAFLAFIGGNAEAAKEAVQERRDAFADDRSQSAVERLNEMAERLEEKADESLGRERKANTERRARFAASAEAAANAEKAMAKTMRRIAEAISNGTAQFLDRVRQKAQIEYLASVLRTAKDSELRTKYPSYADQEKHKGEPATGETADYAEFPQYAMMRSDLANLARKMISLPNMKMLGQRILKVADDTSAAYTAFAKEHLLEVSRFGKADGSGWATFSTLKDAERSIELSNLAAVAVPLQIKRGEYRIVLSPSEAINRGIWKGDDRKIYLSADIGEEIVEKLGKLNRKYGKRRGMDAPPEAPWQFENAYNNRKRLAGMGIEQPWEFRAALREFASLKEAPKEADKIKAMERAMIGRKNDGLDFFPTPAGTAQEMVDAAEIAEGMDVLEPSAGMGHIAEQIREVAGVEPDVIEFNSDRRELLEAKGFNVIGNDFMEIEPPVYGLNISAFKAEAKVIRESESLARVVPKSIGPLSVMETQDFPTGLDGKDLTDGEIKEMVFKKLQRGKAGGYDRIIMNPPFSNRRDAEHVRHAYSLLKPGGRLVAIMGEGVFFGQDKKAVSFREWLDDVGGTSEKLEEGTFLDPSLPVNTATNSRMVVIDKTAGEVAHADNEGAGNVAAQSTISPADKSIYGMAAEGKSAAEILKFIASASRSPFNRQVAKLLLKTGINPSITVGDGKGWKMNAGEGKKYAAGYDPKKDMISLFRPAAAERNMLHELMHAATLRALSKKGLAAGQMAALFKHVKQSGALKGMYGMSDIDEFVAEAFSNPKFQDALKKIAAPKASGSTLSSAWHWFVRIVRGILGIPQGQENALSQAIALGLGVMRENMKLSDTGGDTRYALSGDKRKPKQTDSEAFRKWFGSSVVVNADGQPLLVYHGTGATDINDFKVSDRGTYGGGIYLTPDIRGANDYAIYRGAPSSTVYPVYAAIKNPASGSEAAQVASWKGEENAREELIRRGYDGVVDVRSGEIVAFYPSQVKSAIGNSGDFDASNPDIRYNVADEGWSVSEPSKMDDLIYALQDKQIDMKRVVQSIMRTGKKVKDEVNAYLQEELFHGRAAKGVKDFLDFELRPLLKEMQEANVDMGDFEEYLWNRHAEERNKQIAKINPDMPDGGSGIETAKARAYLAGLSAEQRKTFEMLAAKVEAMNRESQRVLVESGLEKQSTIDAWNGAYQHYVPLQRDDVDSGHVGTGKGFSVRGSSSKRAMGSGKKVVDIIANLTMQRERNIVRAEKNRVSNALLGLAVQNPNPDFWKVDQAPKERVVQEKAIYTVLDSDGNKIEEFTRMDEAERLANKTPGASIDQTWGDRVTERVTPGFTSRDNVLLTRINGEDHYVIFNEQDERAMRMAAAMKNLDMDNLGRVLSVVGKATRYLASINTQYNPIFGVINLVRDTQGALINLSSTPLAGEQKRVLGYTKDALVGIYKDIRAHRSGAKPSSNWAALFEEFQKEGGQTGYRDQYANAEARAESIKSELEQFKDGKAKQLARGLFGWLSDYNETMENAVRLAAYKAAKDKGMSNQQAASLAKNITVNFNRKGQMATQVGALYAFFNASVQGSARIAETLFDQHGGDIKNVRLSKKGKQILAGGIMLGAMQALLLAAAGFDDDEPPEFIRERNLILPIGGGKYLTLAMPLGLHVIPGIGRIATEFVLSGGKDPLKRIAAFGSMFADAFNPIGSAGWSLQTITPSVVDPFAALAENKDFTGKEIYREDFNKLNPTPGHARAKDVATFYSRAISEALNFITGGSEFKPGLVSWSPDSIDYLIGQVTGGVGREANKALQTAGSAYSGEDLPLYKIPLVGRFVGDTAGQSGQSQKFYDAIKQINMHEAQYKGLIKDGRSAEAREYLAENPAVRLIMAGNHAELAVRKLRTMKRDLVENDADQDKIRAIDARITETMRRFNERAGAFI